jgi:hypothetical protein
MSAPTPMNVDAFAKFPSAMRKLFGAGYDKIPAELNDWRGKA